MVERLRRSNIDSAVAARHSNPNVRGSDGPPDPLLPEEGDDWKERCREFRRMLPPDIGDNIDGQTYLRFGDLETFTDALEALEVISGALPIIRSVTFPVLS